MKKLKPGFSKNYFKKEIREIESGIDLSSAAMERVDARVGNKLDDLSAWFLLKVESGYIAALDALGKDETYDDILTSEHRAKLVEILPTLKFSVYAKTLLLVPIHMKGDLLGYSNAVIKHSHNVEAEVNSSLDKLEVVMSSLISGNGTEGIGTLKKDLKALSDRKSKYRSKTGKYLGSRDNVRLFLPEIYGNPDEILTTFDLLRGNHDILRASILSNLVTKSKNLSRLYRMLDKTKLDRPTMLSLMYVIQTSAESLEFVALAVHDLMSCMSSSKAHADEITND